MSAAEALKAARAIDIRAGIDGDELLLEASAPPPRAQAEARAFACCIGEWLNRNPVRSPPGRCLGFGGGDHAHDPPPYGMESTGHAWLHSRCWPARYAGRKAEAVAALAAMGIAASADLPDDFGKNGSA